MDLLTLFPKNSTEPLLTVGRGGGRVFLETLRLQARSSVIHLIEARSLLLLPSSIDENGFPHFVALYPFSFFLRRSADCGITQLATVFKDVLRKENSPNDKPLL